MSAYVTQYSLDDGALVGVEVDAGDEFRPASTGRIVENLRERLEPALEAARLVLEQAKKAGPDEVSIRFALKASGEVNWIIAKTASEGNLEVTMTWRARYPTEMPQSPESAAR